MTKPEGEMGPIGPDETEEDIQRKALEQYRELKARRAAGVIEPVYPAERVRRFMHDLLDRFSAAGKADPAIIHELMADLRKEAEA